MGARQALKSHENGAFRQGEKKIDLSAQRIRPSPISQLSATNGGRCPELDRLLQDTPMNTPNSQTESKRAVLTLEALVANESNSAARHLRVSTGVRAGGGEWYGKFAKGR